MSKRLSAIGCCLLLAAPVAGCAPQMASSGLADNGTGVVTMSETDRRVAEAAAKANGWDVKDVLVRPLEDAAAAGCRLLAASSPNTLPSIRRTYAVVGDDIVAAGDEHALARVLAACGADASPVLWAEAVAAFGQDVPPGYVIRDDFQISSVAHKWAMEAGGYEFHPPRFSAPQAVEFLMKDIEGNTLFKVRARRDEDGAVHVRIGPAGGA